MKKVKMTYFLPVFALLASCSNDPVEEVVDPTENQPIEQQMSDAMVETANPDTPVGIQDVYFAGRRLPVETYGGNYVYQGDILLPKNLTSTQEVQLVYEKDQVPTTKSVGRTSGLWPNNTVYYSIDSGLSDQSRVTEAIAHWEANTNLEFQERSTQSDYVYFTNGSGCSSYVGKIGGRQELTVGSSCTTGNVIHEIGHAVGLWHEQSRVDREEFITINYNNIEDGREHNFQTYQQQGFDGEEYTNSLDFGSIMMYGSYSFSSNGQPTIVRKDGSTFRIQRNGLSTGDKTGINNMYPYSDGGTTATGPVYENGQYYLVEGVMVYRSGGKWYYYTRNYGWKQVKLSSYGYWYYV